MDIREALTVLEGLVPGQKIDTTRISAAVGVLTREYVAELLVIPLVADALAASFQACGGVNFVEFRLHSAQLGPMFLTLQRESGLTPANKLAMCEAARDVALGRIKDLEAELADLKGERETEYAPTVPRDAGLTMDGHAS